MEAGIEREIRSGNKGREKEGANDYADVRQMRCECEKRGERENVREKRMPSDALVMFPVESKGRQDLAKE